MQKLKRAYPELQSDAKNHFDKVTIERARKLHAYANKEYESQVAQGEYGNLDQLDFYREKFQVLVDLFNSAIENKTKKSKLQADVNNLLADNYGQGTPQGPHYIKEQVVPPRHPNQMSGLENQAMIKEERSAVPSKIDPKEVLHSFFDNKVNQIQKSKVGFRSVLETMPKASQKRNVKASNLQGSKLNGNDRQIENLTYEIKALNKKLQEEKETNNFNQGLYQAQKQDYESRIKDLVQQIQKLNRENQSIKNEGSKFIPQPQPKQPSENKAVYEYHHHHHHFDPQDNSPHTIKYRENDLYKLKQKRNKFDDSFGKSGEVDSPLMKNQAKLQELVRKRSEDQIQIHDQHPHQRIELHQPTREQEFQRSNLRFARSEADNEDKNIAVRSKLSFFKPEIVLYRGELFQLAVKTCELVDLQSRKIIIYINNKDKFDHAATLNYSYDPQYYELTVTRKIHQLRGCKQSKEQIQVRWKDKMDFDSMIEVKLNIQNSVLNSKQLKFLLPTMFIEFQGRKPGFYAKELYEKNTVAPIYQFSSIYLAQDIIPFEKDYEDRIQVATIFARSKHHQGYITLRWKVRGEVEVETIRPWKLLFSYLFSKEY